MPFIGRDWRSPGEAWVKTEGFGWQRAKIIESTYSYSTNRLRDSSGSDSSTSCDNFESTIGSWPPRIISSSSSNFAIDSGLKLHNSNCQHSQTTNNSNNNNSSNKNVPTILFNCGHDENCDHHHHHHSCCNRNNFSNENKDAHNFSLHCTGQQRSMKRSNTSSQFVEFNSSCSSTSTSPSTPISSASSSQSQSPDRQQFGRSCKSCCSSNYTGAISPIDNTSSNSDSSASSRSNSRSPCGMRTASPCHHFRSRSPLPPNTGLDNCSMSCNGNRHSIASSVPHCPITLKPTREVTNCNTISDAFYRLDFCNAIHDIRRFSYVCKLLHLLITQNLTSLSGCATKILFTMLEQVAWQVSCNKQNIHILYNLLEDLKKMIQRYYCWGRPIGSTALWRQHFTTIERISNMANQIDLSSSAPTMCGNDCQSLCHDSSSSSSTSNSSSNNCCNESSPLKITDLPVEMIREILLRLNDYRDLVNCARSSPVFQSMLSGQHIWRQLCKYHFTKQQLRQAINNYYAQHRALSNTVRLLQESSSSSQTNNSSLINGQSNSNTLLMQQPVTASKDTLSSNINRHGSSINIVQIDRNFNQNQNKFQSQTKSNQSAGETQSPPVQSSAAKFARTESADGRHTCRRPVHHSPDSPSSSSTSFTLPSTNSNSNLISSNHCQEKNDNISPMIQNKTTTNTVTPSDSEQNVNNTKKVFRKLQSSSFQQSRSFFVHNQIAELNSKNKSTKTPIKKISDNKSFNNNNYNSNTKTTLTSTTTINKGNNSIDNKTAAKLGHDTTKKSDNEIDWEQMFHQLRKKFGLKEEYPDCLLLCRHCRCLFWKSFGHPCIKDAQQTSTSSQTSLPTSSSKQQEQAKSHPLATEHAARARDRHAGNELAARISVAALSRRFHSDPTNSDSISTSSTSGAKSNSSMASNVNLLKNSNEPEKRRPILDDFDLNILRQRRALGLDINDDEDYENLSPAAFVASDASFRRPAVFNPPGPPRRNSNGPPQSQYSQSPPVVPSHIAISPQAFLKFFSL